MVVMFGRFSMCVKSFCNQTANPASCTQRTPFSRTICRSPPLDDLENLPCLNNIALLGLGKHYYAKPAGFALQIMTRIYPQENVEEGCDSSSHLLKRRSSCKAERMVDICCKDGESSCDGLDSAHTDLNWHNSSMSQKILANGHSRYTGVFPCSMADWRC